MTCEICEKETKNVVRSNFPLYNENENVFPNVWEYFLCDDCLDSIIKKYYIKPFNMNIKGDVLCPSCFLRYESSWMPHPISGETMCGFCHKVVDFKNAVRYCEITKEN